MKDDLKTFHDLTPGPDFEMKEYRILGNVEFSNVDLTLEKRTVVDTSSAIKVLVASSSLLSLLQLSTFSAEEDTVSIEP